MAYPWKNHYLDSQRSCDKNQTEIFKKLVFDFTKLGLYQLADSFVTSALRACSIQLVTCVAITTSAMPESFTIHRGLSHERREPLARLLHLGLGMNGAISYNDKLYIQTQRELGRQPQHYAGLCLRVLPQLQD